MALVKRLPESNTITDFNRHARTHADGVWAECGNGDGGVTIVDVLFRFALQGDIESFRDADFFHLAGPEKSEQRTADQPDGTDRMNGQRRFNGAGHAVTILDSMPECRGGFQREKHQAGRYHGCEQWQHPDGRHLHRHGHGNQLNGDVQAGCFAVVQPDGQGAFYRCCHPR